MIIISSKIPSTITMSSIKLYKSIERKDNRLDPSGNFYYIGKKNDKPYKCWWWWIVSDANPIAKLVPRSSKVVLSKKAKQEKSNKTEHHRIMMKNKIFLNEIKRKKEIHNQFLEEYQLFKEENIKEKEELKNNNQLLQNKLGILSEGVKFLPKNIERICRENKNLYEENKKLKFELEEANTQTEYYKNLKTFQPEDTENKDILSRNTYKIIQRRMTINTIRRNY